MSMRACGMRHHHRSPSVITLESALCQLESCLQTLGVSERGEQNFQEADRLQTERFRERVRDIVTLVFGLFNFNDPSEAFSAAKVPQVDAIIEARIDSFKRVGAGNDMLYIVDGGVDRMIAEDNANFKWLLVMLIVSRMLLRLASHGIHLNMGENDEMNMLDDLVNFVTFDSSRKKRRWSKAEKDSVMSGYLAFVLPFYYSDQVRKSIGDLDRGARVMLRNAFESHGYTVDTPRNSSGKRKATGIP